jgi:hypothetical protein
MKGMCEVTYFPPAHSEWRKHPKTGKAHLTSHRGVSPGSEHHNTSFCGIVYDKGWPLEEAFSHTITCKRCLAVWQKDLMA